MATFQGFGLTAGFADLRAGFSCQIRSLDQEEGKLRGQSASAISVLTAACATVAEVRKRGADFWSEFEFYLSDLVVGCVLDVVLVSLMAPTVAVTAKRASAGRKPPLPPLTPAAM
jgi:hypothetical protein